MDEYRYNKLYWLLYTLTGYETLIFLATWYRQADYPDYCLNYVFYSTLLFPIAYGIYVLNRNKGLFAYCKERIERDRKSISSLLPSVLFIAMAFASFILHGKAAYIIQNILYVSAFIVLIPGLILVRIKFPSTKGF